MTDSSEVYGLIVELADWHLEGSGSALDVCGDLEIALYSAISLIPQDRLQGFWTEVRSDLRERHGQEDEEDSPKMADEFDGAREVAIAPRIPIIGDPDCTWCQGKGFALSNRDDGIQAIQRCDECDAIESDDAAAVIARKYLV